MVQRQLFVFTRKHKKILYRWMTNSCYSLTVVDQEVTQTVTLELHLIDKHADNQYQMTPRHHCWGTVY